MWVYKYVIIYYTIIDTPVLKIWKYALIICTSSCIIKNVLHDAFIFHIKETILFLILCMLKWNKDFGNLTPAIVLFFCPYNSFFPYPLMEKQS